MLINEAGLVRAIKDAYKTGGYTVNNQDGAMAIYTQHWYVQARREVLPRKALATIVEHMGMIPDEQAPVYIIKGDDLQTVMEEIAAEDLTHWRSGNSSARVDMVPVIMQGYQIFQAGAGGGACWGIPLSFLGMIERNEAEHYSPDVIDDNRLLWKDDTTAIVVEAVRKAASRVAKAWERAVWQALEGVDLHKEEE